MARVITKIGDVFSVNIDEKTKKYFQYVANDLTQLNSDVIRAFKKVYFIDSIPELSEVVKGEIDFYAHCVTNLGIKMGLWKKVGTVNDVGKIENILFRDTNDAGKKVGEEAVKISEKWYVWRINDENITRVGKLEKEKRKAEIGVVVNPFDIIDRMRTGKYNFVYPGYE